MKKLRTKKISYKTSLLLSYNFELKDIKLWEKHILSLHRLLHQACHRSAYAHFWV